MDTLYYKLPNKLLRTLKLGSIFVTTIFLSSYILIAQSAASSFFLVFKKYKFIYLNWRLITLQYCIGFSIHQHESAMGVHVFPILNPPSHLPPCTIPLGHPRAPAPKQPVSCIELGLAIRFLYDIIHVSMPFSQIVPPSPSPTESKRLFYTSVSLVFFSFWFLVVVIFFVLSDMKSIFDFSI